MNSIAPEVTPLTAPYWEGISAGELRYQSCRACGNAWLPAREDCPGCLANDVEWLVSSGLGRVVSWVTYHRAVHPFFEDLTPYDVVVVELDEGPRLITNATIPTSELHIDLSVRFATAERAGVTIPVFGLA